MAQMSTDKGLGKGAIVGAAVEVISDFKAVGFRLEWLLGPGGPRLGLKRSRFDPKACSTARAYGEVSASIGAICG